MIGLLAAAVRDPDPVLFFEHKSIYPMKFEIPDGPGDIVDDLGTAKIVREGKDITIVALALMVPARSRPPSSSPPRASTPRSSTCARSSRSTPIASCSR